MQTVNNYWSLNDRYKAKYGTYLPTVFDFISIHRDLNIGNHRYTLIAPLCICENGNRPSFESETFATKRDAIKRARQLCKEHKLKLVDCCIY